MKVPELKMIYWITGFLFVMQSLAIFGGENDAQRIGFSIGSIILFIIILGLIGRSELVRKIAVYYFSFTLLFGAIRVLIMAPYTALFTQEPFDIYTFIYELIVISAAIFVIRALVNEPLLSEFSSNKSLESDAG